MSSSDDGRFVSVSLENLMDDKIIEHSIDRSGGKINRMPSLWNIISVIDPDGEGEMDKFLVKRAEMDQKIYASLNDISYFYYRHGY